MVEVLRRHKDVGIIAPHDVQFQKIDTRLRSKHPEVPQSTFLLNGDYYASVLGEELKTRREALEAKGIIPGIAAIVSTDDPASLSYVRRKEEFAKQIGIRSRVFSVDNNTNPREMLELIEELNNDQTFHGILMQVPIPPHLREYEAMMRAALNPLKDVDCMTPENVGRFYEGNPRFVHATPGGVMEMFRLSGIKTAGQHIVVVGRSNIVGRPMAALLAGKDANATVTICHSQTPDIAEYTRQGDIVISAVGQPDLITADMVKEGVIVIDVANNRKADPTRKNGWRMVGDVDFNAVAKKARAITPVPGGVGPMTVAMVSANTVLAAEAFAA